MASRTAHDVAGALAGGAVAAVSARDQTPLFKVAELVGGTLGGLHGSRLPDILEPAVTPRHRGPAHSIVGGFIGGASAMKYTPVPVQKLRGKARELEAAMAFEANIIRAWMLLLAAVACHVAAGYVVGAATGYGSHLALDALTPRSLPLLIGDVG
jgi:membrane-bound metal-dependent hydrolase YbcI (DUF457 family)